MSGNTHGVDAWVDKTPARTRSQRITHMRNQFPALAVQSPITTLAGLAGVGR